jgi:hypothetical protein
MPRNPLLYLSSCVFLLLAGCGREPLRFPLERTHARLERGNFLVNNVIGCFGCHSECEWDGEKASLPKAGAMGGGARFAATDDPPFPLYVPNISPDPETGAGKWTDEDFVRALTQGIGHDGRLLFGMMPYEVLRANLSDEDMAAVIVYVRSIAPVRHAVQRTELPPAVKASLKTLAPRPPVPAPDLSDARKRAAYYMRLADCTGCHTPYSKDGKPIAGMEFGGGSIFRGPWGEVASANLTPDPSGIPYYDDRMFLEVMHTGRNGARKINPIMPWRYFRNLADDDLKGIFANLRNLKPVTHRTDNTEAFAPCKRCGNRHGLGDMN